ncbi:hypothetical protein KP509_17G055500 [Ceratopteris richardii]|uniref:FAD-binding domain-containing protein n=1 Tax=Ceratopteris richardii TaxID=49495 RepID=A0A8T2SVY0_CERRI|nr:hypothetical protein KP509_17G055500 [Ceratopteris richardii]
MDVLQRQTFVPELVLQLNISFACRSLNVRQSNNLERLQIHNRTICSAARQKTRQPTDAKSLSSHKPVVWRFLSLEVPAERDLGKDDCSVSHVLLDAIAHLLACPIKKGPRFVYTVDLHVDKLREASLNSDDVSQRLKSKPGKLELVSDKTCVADVTTLVSSCMTNSTMKTTKNTENKISSLHAPLNSYKHPNVTVIGSGPAGLFTALVLAESGAKVTLVERGHPVEIRGHDIGQLMVRRRLQPDSNFCYGEGGAGTWSDGKLTTRIGRNSETVKSALATLVKFGAPSSILISGKPHIGTDKLIHILRKIRSHLQSLGVNMRFGLKMIDFLVRENRIVGTKVQHVEDLTCEDIFADAVILAAGHSARDIYHKLLQHGVHLSPKDFAVGFRVEHPQELVNEIQYNEWASEVQRGSGKIPVADYKVTTSISESSNDNSLHPRQSSCYSFCMCPGGQIVLTSTDPAELCINGMSFSRRSSKWANSALVMPVSHSDLEPFLAEHGPLAGVAFQKFLERKASLMGGGDLVVPVQTVPDFLENHLSRVLPSSSYRLGVKEAALHELFPDHMTRMFKQALLDFNKQIPGFIDRRALLHAVETRTSSPVRIDRDTETFECISMQGLYPIGEGAGYAGGIVSAAVDGLNAGLALAEQFGLCKVILKENYVMDKLIYY